MIRKKKIEEKKLIHDERSVETIRKCWKIGEKKIYVQLKD